jgi:hypothetical protein
VEKPTDAELAAFELHRAALDLAVGAQILSTARYEFSPNDIVRDALFVLSHDAACIHQAIGQLVFTGWSSPAAPLVRTLLDLMVSELAILNGASRPLAAFKYLYSNFRSLSRDMQLPATNRANMRKQVRQRIAQLPPEQRDDALRAYAEKDRAYWFSPEWPSPSAVIAQFGVPGMADFYRQFSAAAHGGFFGLRLFRDQPDRIDINPRRPPSTHALSVAYISAKLLVEIARGRNEYEGLDIGSACSALVKAINATALPDKS